MAARDYHDVAMWRKIPATFHFGNEKLKFANENFCRTFFCKISLFGKIVSKPSAGTKVVPISLENKISLELIKKVSTLQINWERKINLDEETPLKKLQWVYVNREVLCEIWWVYTWELIWSFFQHCKIISGLVIKFNLKIL